MITLRPSSDRGHVDHGWLKTYHTFSFGDYHDPAHMHFRGLRVINDDVVGPGQGFGMHPHKDMEILTWIVSGSLQHKDSMGNGEVIRPGDLQHMSAGTGVLHSEFNPSKSDAVRLLQIWIMPEQRGLAPRYGQVHFETDGRANRLQKLASRAGVDGSIGINADATLYASVLQAGHNVSHDLAPGRSAWLQVINGAVNLNGTAMHAGDGAAIRDESRLTIAATQNSDFLLFDLA